MMLSEHHPKKHYYSLKNAWVGIYSSILTQRNFRLELVFGIAAIVLAIYFGFTTTKFMIVIATILLVLGFEMVNTSIEAMVDSVHVEHNDLAKVSKDVAAGAVLIMVILSVIVGLYLYLPPILDLFG